MRVKVSMTENNGVHVEGVILESRQSCERLITALTIAANMVWGLPSEVKPSDQPTLTTRDKKEAKSGDSNKAR